jgi:uncharacterized protein GlcG (DUF336 family)
MRKGVLYSTGGTAAYRSTSALAALALLLASCGGGGNSPSPAATPPPSPSPTPVFSVPAQESLSVADVQQVIAQAVGEARARNRPAVITVVDRVGNVLAIFRMNGAPLNAAASPAPNGQNIDVQGRSFPAEGGAIAKAITGAYLSSGGNAFSTRTASQIVQQHFPPAPNAVGLESGPLFGVQFSQLPCSDLNTRFVSTGGPRALIGPKRSPLGLSADPGGFPLYKNGVLVGGIGVMADGVYGFDPDIIDVDNDDEEYIALAGTIGFDAPEDIRANRINVDGTALRYSDAVPSGFLSTPASAPNFATINGTVGALGPVRDYATIQLIAGAAYGSERSGIRPSTPAEFANPDAFVLSDGSGNNRYPIRGATDAGIVAQPLTAAEVRAIMEEAFLIMSRGRAQIRRPLDSRIQVSISVVDTLGSVLGLVRAPDAPIFGIDVSLQKARSVTFLSNPMAAQQLGTATSVEVPAFVARTRTFLNDPAALTGATAFSNRGLGLLARPYFPDGEVGRPNGPLSRLIAQFNPFSTGLQSALIIDNLDEHVAFLTLRSPSDTPPRCTKLIESAPGINRLANGLQIFPGGVPIYRGNQLVGGIGISGDGIDQDDMISFLGLANGARRAGAGLGHAPNERRSDRVVVQVTADREVRLRYVNCPFAPFLDTADQNVCQGI